jgi:hypothetical protein
MVGLYVFVKNIRSQYFHDGKLAVFDANPVSFAGNRRNIGGTPNESSLTIQKHPSGERDKT